jgi:MFS family permease
MTLRAADARPVLGAMWLLFLPSMLLGTLAALAPLQLSRAGWGGTAIAATFVGCAAVEAAAHPLVGRWSDRRGRLVPIRIGLLMTASVAVVLPHVGSRWWIALCVAIAGVACAFLISPAMVLLSTASEALGFSHAIGVVLVNVAFAAGFAAGPAIGGRVAQVAGDAAAWAVVAVLAAVTAIALGARQPLMRVARVDSTRPATRKNTG